MIRLLGIIFFIQFFSSCGNGDDNPCNGSQYVFYAKENQFLEHLLTPEFRTVAFTDLRKAGRPTDTITLNMKIDTVFVYHDGWGNSECFDCDAEAETYRTVLYVPNHDSILLLNDECGYSFNGIDVYINEIITKGGFTINLSDSNGIEYISFSNAYIIESIR